MSRLITLLVSLLLLAACVTPATPASIPASAASTPSVVPEDWIEVILAEQAANLWHGDQLVTSLPISSGVGESPSTTTYTGEYTVATMYPGPEETVAGIFVRDVVMFDWDHGNGFHSLPMDANGAILDPTIGKPASAGCIRLADSDVLYDFAEVGMRVIVR